MIREFDLIILVPSYHEAVGLARLMGLRNTIMPAGELSLRAFLLPQHQLTKEFKFCLVQIGVGEDYPRRVIKELTQVYKSRHYLLTGTAGGINSKYQAGAVILCEEILSDEGLAVGKLKLADSWKHSEFWECGSIVCVQRVINSVAEKQELQQKTGGACVEMEGQGCLAIMKQLQLEANFHQLRVILDDAQTPLKFEIGGLIDYQGNLHWGNLCRLIITKPMILKDLFKLKHISKKSLQSLSVALLRFVQVLKSA
jgi:nucleoside phosphorylase